MASSPPLHLVPRKRPRQARATVTLDVIFEATIQVLLAGGPRRLTTTRVAARAGVSVGTLYQCFPHKQALFYALNEHYLQILAETVETACLARHGAPIGQMVDAIVTTYWNAKTERADVTRALYRSVVELDNEPLIETFVQRVDAATGAMFASASDAVLADLPIVSLTLLTTVFGATRGLFERNLSMPDARAVHRQLVLMCIAYLDAVRMPAPDAAAVPEPSDRPMPDSASRDPANRFGSDAAAD